MRTIHWFAIPSFGAANSQLSVHRWNSEAVEAGGARHLRAELFRMTGTDLTQIEGIDVTTTMTILSEAAWDIKLVWGASRSVDLLFHRRLEIAVRLLLASLFRVERLQSSSV